MLNWIPAFQMRTRRMPLDAMATWFGPAAGITFGIGILGGGWLVSHRAKVSARAHGPIPALATLVLIPTFIAALLVDSWQASPAPFTIPMAPWTAHVAPAPPPVLNLPDRNTDGQGKRGSVSVDTGGT